MSGVEADVLVNLIGDEAATLDRASRVSAEFCQIVGPQLQAVRCAVVVVNTCCLSAVIIHNDYALYSIVNK